MIGIPSLLFAIALFAFGWSGPASGAPSAAIHTVLLVRHGAYDETAKDNANAPLTPLGVAQANLVAARLKLLPEAPSRLVESTMTRAEQTAAEIHAEWPEVPLEQADLLRECVPPVSSDIHLARIDPKAADSCRHQLDRAYAKYFVPTAVSETDILVCHGNVIRYLVAKALGMDPKRWAHFSIGHTSVTEIQIRADGSMRVISVGDIGHLPPNMRN